MTLHRRLIIASGLVAGLAFNSTLGVGPDPSDHIARDLSIQSTTRTTTDAPGRNIEHNMMKPVLQVNQSAGEVSYMAASSNGKYLTVVLADNSIRFWDLQSGVQRPKISGSGAKFLATIPAPDGRSLVASTDDGKLMLFNTTTGLQTQVTTGHQGPVRALAISSDGKMLVSGGVDHSAHIWDLKGLVQSKSLHGHQGEVTSIAMDPDNARILSGSADRTARLWDIRSGKQLAVFAGHSSSVVWAKFIRQGNTAMTGTDTGDVRLWDVSSTKGAQIAQMRAPGNANRGFAVDQSGIYGVFGSNDGRIRLVDIASGKTVRELVGHTGAIRHLVYDPDKQRIISSSADGSIRVWNAQTGENLLRVFMTNNGWAVIDWQGRFDASEQGMKDVSWKAADQDMSLDRFAQQFFEPGLLSAYLASGERPLAPVPGKIENGITLPPKMEIDVPEGAHDTGQPFRLVVVATDQGGGIGTVRLYHNGKLVDPGSLLQQQDVNEREKHLRAVAFDVKPVPGPNTFKAVGTGLWDIEGHSDKLTKMFPGSTPTSTLYIVAVGINKYSDPKLALDYSVPDAKSMVETLTHAAKGVFKEVREHRIFDQEATKRRILDVLSEVSQTSRDDVIVVYLAGHGLAVGKDWEFLPYETKYDEDPNQYVAKGITAAEIQDALVKAKAQRVLLFIDSCQSGAGAQTFNEQQSFQRRYLREVSRIAGVTVLAATRKDQLAAEMTSLGHGLFTYVVLSGLEGKADLRPKDGTVTAHEVVGYAAQTIPSFSQQYLKHDQEPVAFALGADFMLGRLSK